MVTCNMVGHTQLPAINVTANNAQKAKNVALRKAANARKATKSECDKANLIAKFTPERVNEMLAGNKMMKSRFECTGVNDKGFCVLRRVDDMPYHCECCKREHENRERVWPWVLINKGKLMIGCGRNDKKSYVIIQ